jgi:hypothetical protein
MRFEDYMAEWGLPERVLASELEGCRERRVLLSSLVLFRSIFCWHCGKRIRVSVLAGRACLPRLPGGAWPVERLRLPVAADGGLDRRYVLAEPVAALFVGECDPSIWEAGRMADAELEGELGPWRLASHFSRELGVTYWANVCACCGSVQGDHYLQAGAFNPAAAHGQTGPVAVNVRVPGPIALVGALRAIPHEWTPLAPGITAADFRQDVTAMGPVARLQASSSPSGLDPLGKSFPHH